MNGPSVSRYLIFHTSLSSEDLAEMASTQGVNVSRPDQAPFPHAKSDADHLAALQVLRYSALVAGLVYGVYHQSSINSQAKRVEIEHEYTRKERLIEQAKAEWKKKTMPQETKTQASGRT